MISQDEFNAIQDLTSDQRSTYASYTNTFQKYLHDSRLSLTDPRFINLLNHGLNQIRHVTKVYTDELQRTQERVSQLTLTLRERDTQITALVSECLQKLHPDFENAAPIFYQATKAWFAKINNTLKDVDIAKYPTTLRQSQNAKNELDTAISALNRYIDPLKKLSQNLSELHSSFTELGAKITEITREFNSMNVVSDLSESETTKTLRELTDYAHLIFDHIKSSENIQSSDINRFLKKLTDEYASYGQLKAASLSMGPNTEAVDDLITIMTSSLTLSNPNSKPLRDTGNPSAEMDGLTQNIRKQEEIARKGILEARESLGTFTELAEVIKDYKSYQQTSAEQVRLLDKLLTDSSGFCDQIESRIQSHTTLETLTSIDQRLKKIVADTKTVNDLPKQDVQQLVEKIKEYNALWKDLGPQNQSSQKYKAVKSTLESASQKCHYSDACGVVQKAIEYININTTAHPETTLLTQRRPRNPR
jgi:hypothetical protein